MMHGLRILCFALLLEACIGDRDALVAQRQAAATARDAAAAASAAANAEAQRSAALRASEIKKAKISEANHAKDREITAKRLHATERANAKWGDFSKSKSAPQHHDTKLFYLKPLTSLNYCLGIPPVDTHYDYRNGQMNVE
jgi:hypothetical protein